MPSQSIVVMKIALHALLSSAWSVFKIKIWPEKQIIILWPYLKRAVIGQRLLKYDTLAHVPALKLYTIDQ